RRHTRSTRDWSSDVCSSDLGAQDDTLVRFGREERGGRRPPSSFFFTEAARRCHPERARGTRASEGSAGTPASLRPRSGCFASAALSRSFAPAALRMTGPLAEELL